MSRNNWRSWLKKEIKARHWWKWTKLDRSSAEMGKNLSDTRIWLERRLSNSRRDRNTSSRTSMSSINIIMKTQPLCDNLTCSRKTKNICKNRYSFIYLAQQTVRKSRYRQSESTKDTHEANPINQLAQTQWDQTDSFPETRGRTEKYHLTQKPRNHWYKTK